MNNIEQSPKLKSNRKCAECTMCCQGWLSANIYGHMMAPGHQCHYLSNSCAIYKDRPKLCKEYKCIWLEDTNFAIPEWMKPSLSKVIISRKSWGYNNEYFYWMVVECGEKMKSEVLHWIVNFCDSNRIDLEYQFNNQVYRRGSAEFKEYMDNFVSKQKSKKESV